MWVTEDLSKSRNIANVRFPKRLLCTYDDTEKCYVVFFISGFGLFRLFFQAAEVKEMNKRFYFKRQKNTLGFQCYWIPRPTADYRHFGLAYRQLWLAAIKSITGVHHILQIY